MKIIFLIFVSFVGTLLAFSQKCGVSDQATARYGPIIGNHENDQDKVRILGGDESVRGRWPWMAYLRCSGTIIGDRWIMTAAHCIEVVYSHVGVGNINFNLVDYNVEEIFVHPNFNELESYLDDIALLKLRDKIKFNESILPICLWQNDGLNKDEFFVVAGWGDTFDYLRSSTETTDPTEIDKLIVESQTTILNERILTVTNDGQCLELINESDGILDFEHFICHHGVNSGLLPGDSGGPLMALRNNTWIQVGVASWAIFKPRPNNRLDLTEFLVYIRVKSYCNWIAKTTSNEVQCQGSQESNPPDDKNEKEVTQIPSPNSAANGFFLVVGLYLIGLIFS
uniref:Peptidase S1 domain-containing protein n=1 Tax=Panagrolaimus sp. JU765 TaxID=591449 RepID=A0AC34RHN8_9BILA